MVYLLLILFILIIIYVFKFRQMVSRAANIRLCHPEVPEDDKGITVQEFTYKEGREYPWKGRFYAPDNGATDSPCIILYHGEVLDFIKPKPMDWKMFNDYGRLLASKGFSALIFNHHSSRSTKNTAPARGDLLTLLNFIRSDDCTFPVDRDMLFLWAFSGGAYVGLNWLIREKPAYVKGMISYYGILEAKEAGESAVDLMKGAEGEGIPPILIIKAEKDRIRSSNKGADDFLAAAEGKADVRLLPHSGPHGFDGLSKTDETTEVINKTIEFFSDV